MTAPMISFVIRKRDSSDEITAIADAGTFDRLTDNSVALGPETGPIAAADTQSSGAHRLHGRQFGAPPSTTLGCQ
jgi:hypothetical protein